MPDSTNFVIYNAVFFVLLFFISLFNKDSNKLLKSYVLLLWAISAVSSIFMHIMMPWMSSNITLPPYIYLQVCFLIYMIPIYKFKDTNLNYIKISNPELLEYFIIFVSLISLLPFIENTVYLIKTYMVSGGNLGVLESTYYLKNEITVDANLISESWLSRPGRFLNNGIRYVHYSLPFLLFYYLTYKKINKILLAGLTIAILCKIFFDLNMADRMNITYFSLDVLFLFILFRKHIPTGRKKRLVKYGSIVLICFFLFFTTMTIARQYSRSAREKHDNVEFVLFYIAVPQLNFNNYMWHIEQHTQGDNSFSFVKSTVGLPTFKKNLEKREYWNSDRTGIPVHVFYTFIGDWFMDLGKIGTLLFILILSVLLKNATKDKRCISLIALFFFYIYCDIAIRGWTFFGIKAYTGQLILFINIMIVLIISSAKFPRKNLSK